MRLKIWQRVPGDYCLHPPPPYSPKEKINADLLNPSCVLAPPPSLVKPMDLSSVSYA